MGYNIYVKVKESQIKIKPCLFNKKTEGEWALKTISDIIEEFILSQLDDGEINLSRNELANFFNCAPSQINYVLTTRFTPLRGFDIESKRGGGGYIKIVRFTDNSKSNYIKNLITNHIGKSIDYNNALMLLDNLLTNNIITTNEYKIIAVAISNKSLSSPINNEDVIRAKILTSICLEKCKEY